MTIWNILNAMLSIQYFLDNWTEFDICLRFANILFRCLLRTYEQITLQLPTGHFIELVLLYVGTEHTLYSCASGRDNINQQIISKLCLISSFVPGMLPSFTSHPPYSSLPSTAAPWWPAATAEKLSWSVLSYQQGTDQHTGEVLLTFLLLGDLGDS